MESIPFLFQQVFSNKQDIDNDSGEYNIKTFKEKKSRNEKYTGLGKQNEKASERKMSKDDETNQTAFPKKKGPRHEQNQKKNGDIVANFSIIVKKYQ